MNIKFPVEGEFWPAKEKKYEPVFVFIHHYGGNFKTSRRHIRFIHLLGFDAVSMTFSFNDADQGKFAVPRSSRGRWGIRHFWYDELTEVVAQIERPIIYYSFSSLSNTVIDAIANFDKKPIAWICDGGPFLLNYKRVEDYAKLYIGVRSYPIVKLASMLSYLTWDAWRIKRDLKNWLDQFPEHFPILSFQGENDPLVPPAFTQAVFNLSARIQPETVLIKGGGHLDGLRDHREQYAPALIEFLNKKVLEAPNSRGIMSEAPFRAPHKIQT